jgi:hypothetical protein
MRRSPIDEIRDVEGRRTGDDEQYRHQVEEHRGCGTCGNRQAVLPSLLGLESGSP